MGAGDKKERITKLLEQTPSKIKLKTPGALQKRKDWDDSVSASAIGAPVEGKSNRGGRNADGKNNSVRNDLQSRSKMQGSKSPTRGDSPNAAYTGKNTNKPNAYKKNLYLYNKAGRRGKSPGKKTTKRSALSGNGDEQLNISESNRRIEKYDNMIGAALGRRNKDYDVPKKLSLGYRPVIPDPGHKARRNKNYNLDLQQERNEEHLSAVSVPPLKIPKGDPYYEEEIKLAQSARSTDQQTHSNYYSQQ